MWPLTRVATPAEVVAAIFQALQRLDQQGRDRRLADDSDDAAHGRIVTLLSALTTDHCRKGRNKNIEIKPKRPVSDVEAILRALLSEVAIATR